MRLLPSGDSGLLIECDDLTEVGRLHAAVRDRPPDGLIDLVPAARTLLLVLDPGITSPGAAGRAVSGLELGEVSASGPEVEVVEIGVHYDGEDLAEVASVLGCAPPEVVRQHTDGTWRVAFCGFAPGFGYLIPEDAEPWSIPRRDSPRTRVPAGAVGLAGEFTGLYPRESPGGWQLIGRTRTTLFDPDRDPPALLSPGTRVRFVEQS